MSSATAYNPASNFMNIQAQNFNFNMGMNMQAQNCNFNMGVNTLAQTTGPTVQAILRPPHDPVRAATFKVLTKLRTLSQHLAHFEQCTDEQQQFLINDFCGLLEPTIVLRQQQRQAYMQREQVARAQNQVKRPRLEDPQLMGKVPLDDLHGKPLSSTRPRARRTKKVATSQSANDQSVATAPSICQAAAEASAGPHPPTAATIALTTSRANTSLAFSSDSVTMPTPSPDSMNFMNLNFNSWTEQGLDNIDWDAVLDQNAYS